MYGQYRNSGIRRLHDYKDALSWYERTTPIRGKGTNAGVRPLGHRNRTHFQILKREDNSIVCRLYRTDVVTFHPDGVVSLKDEGYVTQTTANFIYDVLGIHGCIADRDVQLGIGSGLYRLKKGMQIKRNEAGVYQVINHEPHYVYGIDRKRMGELRKQTKPFRDFLTGMMKVREAKYERDELIDVLAEAGIEKGSNWSLEIEPWREDAAQVLPRLRNFVETITQEDSNGNWYRASLMLLWSGRHYYSVALFDATTAFKALDDVLIATHPEVLQVRECGLGEFKKNAYRRFTKYKELAK